ncbi:MAG: hypothetical protein WBM41_01905 [Arenicellales bacterium]
MPEEAPDFAKILETLAKQLSLSPEYQDWTVEELQSALKPSYFKFAQEYIRNGGNKVGAYRDAIWIHKPGNREWAEGKSGNDIARKINSSAYRIIENSLVSAYIIKFQEQERARIEEETRFQYDRWLNRMDDLSKGAEKEKQFSPAIRAHELIGKAAGHIDSNRQDQLSRVDDRHLTSKLADILGITANTLSQALHGNTGSENCRNKGPIEGEIADAEELPNP